MSGHLVVMRGLPGSGKSTIAENSAAEIGKAVIFSRDDFRGMLAPDHLHRDGTPTGEIEDLITQAQRQGVAEALRRDFTVFVADTNLPHRRVREWLGLAEREGATWYVNDLTDVPLAKCLDRNNYRLDPVPESVIRNMHAKYIASGNAKPKEWIPVSGSGDAVAGEPYAPDWEQPRAVIVDIDGTLAKMNGRSPYDYTRVGEDLPNQPVIDYVEALTEAYPFGVGDFAAFEPQIILMSGRPETCREETEAWLHKHGIHWDRLLMRSEQEYKGGVRDDIVKLRLFNEHVRQNYNVHSVVDDRSRVVKMWRSLGLTVLQVDEGNF